MRRRRLLGTAIWSLVVIILWPSDAWAWGPAAHLDIGLQVLEHAALLSPLLRHLLLDHGDDFLYGCCAADIVVGKNLASARHHCHNWRVGLRVLASARSPGQRALGYGFLAHLAADTVAHNFFVPYKTVESFRFVAAKHTYWELRFDKSALERPGVRAALARVGRTHARAHDEFLGEHLAESSRLFSFGLSRRLFASMLHLSRLRRWQQMVASVAERSPLPLAADEVLQAQRHTLDAVFSLLIDAEASRALTADPTGQRSLRVAKELRRELRKLWRRGRLPEQTGSPLALDLRRRFLDGIYGRLDIPDTPSLLKRVA